MDAEIDTDGRTIWVNGPDGCCLGRFSPFGIDAHRTFAEQARRARSMPGLHA